MVAGEISEFEGQGVVVTGAGSGIGLAIAEAFAGGGAKVYICDCDADALAAATAACPAIDGTLADVGVSSEVEALFAKAKEVLERVDVLVNNAGIGGPAGPVESVAVEDWERTIAVNLSGMFYCIKEAVPLMKQQGGGSIINISTGSVSTSVPFRAPYVASKAGVHGLTRTLARELGPDNIRCNAILPGAIDNGRGRALVQRLADERGQSFEEAEAGFLRYVSMRTWIDPSEIAATTLFLASNAGRHITGQEIGVCGNIEWEE